MKSLGHKWIDVLKMDIEGGEWDFLEHLYRDAKPIPVSQVCGSACVREDI